MNQQNALIRLPQVFDCGGRFSSTDKWFIEFYVRNPKNGKMVRFKKYKGINKFHSLKERQAAAEKMRKYWTDKLRAGWTPFNDPNIIYDDNLEFQTAITKYRKMKASNGTFRFYASKYIDFKSGELEPASLSTYRSRLRIFDGWLEGQGLNTADISCIDNKILIDFSWHIINNVELSRSTVLNYQNLLKEVFEHVRKDRKQLQNPCFDLPMTRRVCDSPAMPIQDMDRIVFKEAISANDPQLWMACQFIYYCFIRPRKELRYLKIGDIDFGRGVIRIRPENAKTDKSRVVTIPNVFLKELRHTYKLHEFNRNYFVIGKGGQPGPGSVSYNNMSNRWVAFRRRLGMPEEYKMYSWKHTGNGRADIAGIPRPHLSGQNGHTTYQMTEVYLKNINGVVSPFIKESFPEI